MPCALIVQVHKSLCTFQKNESFKLGRRKMKYLVSRVFFVFILITVNFFAEARIGDTEFLREIF